MVISSGWSIFVSFFYFACTKTYFGYRYTSSVCASKRLWTYFMVNTIRFNMQQIITAVVLNLH